MLRQVTLVLLHPISCRPLIRRSRNGLTCWRQIAWLLEQPLQIGRRRGCGLKRVGQWAMTRPMSSTQPACHDLPLWRSVSGSA